MALPLQESVTFRDVAVPGLCTENLVPEGDVGEFQHPGLSG